MAKLVEPEGDGRDLAPGEGIITVGTSPEREIHLPDEPLVSARHASLRFENNRWFIRDEGSTYGTFVNRRRVTEQGLQDGDVVELGLGGATLRFEADEDERQRSAAITGGRLKPYDEEDGDDAEPLEGAGKLAIPVAARGVLLALGGVVLLILGALWVGGWGTDPADSTAGEDPVAMPPDGPFYPLQVASRSYFDEMPQMSSAVERHRNGGVRRSEVEEELAVVTAGIETADDNAGGLDSLEARRAELEADLALLDRLGEAAGVAAESMVLIQTGFQADTFYFPGPTGTGFFVGEDGRLVTSRRVVAPDTYFGSADEAGLACALQRLAEDGTEATRVISVWAPGSTPALRPVGGLDPATATHSTQDGTVELIGVLGGESASSRAIACPEGGVVETRQVSDGTTDLALLEVAGGPWEPLSLADGPPAPGEVVLLGGFPRGGLPEGGRLDPWFTWGPVSEVAGSIRFDVPVLPGVDGGPLLSADARVLGVGTGTRNDRGVALGAERVRALLGGS